MLLPSIAAAQHSVRATVEVQAVVVASVAPPSVSRVAMAALAAQATANPATLTSAHEHGPAGVVWSGAVLVPAPQAGQASTVVVTTIVP